MDQEEIKVVEEEASSSSCSSYDSWMEEMAERYVEDLEKNWDHVKLSNKEHERMIRNGIPTCGYVYVPKKLPPADGLLPTFSTDQVSTPTVCTSCNMKPCIMLSCQTEVRGEADICADSGVAAYFVKLHMSVYMKKKLECLLQKKLDEAPPCFDQHLTRWFPDDMSSSDEEDELDAEEEHTTG